MRIYTLYIVAIDEPGGNRNRSINIKAQHKTRRAAITQIYFIKTFITKKLTFRLYPKTLSKQMIQ